MRPIWDLPPKKNDKAADAAIAQYNAMRAEIVGYQNAQAALVGVAVTAIGVLLGLVLQSSASRQLLVVVPVLCFFVSALYSAYGYKLGQRGDFIRYELWPQVLELTGASVPSWELTFQARKETAMGRLADGLLEIWPTLLLAVAAAVSTIYAWPSVSLSTALAAAGLSASTLGFRLVVHLLNGARSRRWAAVVAQARSVAGREPVDGSS